MTSNNKILSEIYFNRALIWILLGYVAILNDQNMWVVVGDFALAVLNMIHSYVISRKE